MTLIKMGSVTDIGVDADGTKNNLEEFNFKVLVPEYKKLFRKQNGLPADFEVTDAMVIKNPNGYDIREIVGCTDEERSKIWTPHLIPYCLTYPPRKDCFEVIKTWQDEGKRVHDITARIYTTDGDWKAWLSRKMFETWNLMYGFPKGVRMDSITYCSEKNAVQDKIEACQRLGIQVMAEDRMDNAEGIAGMGVNVQLFQASYNPEITKDNIQLINAWPEAYQNVRQLELTKGSKE